MGNHEDRKRELETERISMSEDSAPDLESLVKALRDEDSDVRDTAAYDLGRLGDTRAVESLISALGDENDHVREGTCSALGWLGDRRAVEPLIQMMQDPSVLVRMSAALALGHLGDERALPVLEWAEQHDKGEWRPGDDVQGCAVYAIVEIMGKKRL